MARVAAFVLVLTLGALAIPGVGAASSEPCEQEVLADWAADGRIDGVYALPCYEAAIDALPTDVRDYTDAADVIGRALTAGLRSANDDDDDRALAAASDDPSRPASTPTSLLVLAAVAAGALAATAGGFVLVRERRRSEARRRGGAA